LAGGLATLGAELVVGFDVVAERIGLEDRLEHADLVITGEGYLDAQSFEGKAVGGVIELARAANVSSLIVAGDHDPTATLAFDAPFVTLVDAVGEERAFADTLTVVEEIVRDYLR